MPGPDPRQRATLERSSSSATGVPVVATLLALNEEQVLVISALRAQERGMTLRQLEVALSCPAGTVQQSLDALLERRLVARLNTIVPSYVCRDQGMDQFRD